MPYRPNRYKEIVKERYIIATKSHIPYADVGNMTPIERDYVLEFIQEDLRRELELLNKHMPHKG